MDTGKRIRQARKNAKLTQAQLAEKSGVAAISIHQYESGKRQPRMEQLKAIADALGISVESLITEEKQIAPGLTRRVVDNPDSDVYEYYFDADTPEKLDAILDQLRESGVFQKILLDAFQQLNTAGQQAVSQFAVRLLQIPEMRESATDMEVSKDGLDEKKDN